MAVADKTYMTLETYEKIRTFWIETYDQQIKQLGKPIYMYPFEEFKTSQQITPEFLNQNKKDLEYFWKEKQERAVLNTSSLEDAWLYQYCDIIDMSRLGGDDKFSSLMDFTEEEPPYIVSINYGDKSQLYLWTEYSGDEINVIDNFHVFGSTDFYKFWHTAKKIVTKNFYYDQLNLDQDFEVEFFAYGHVIKAVKERDSVKYFIGEKEIEMNVSIPLDKFFFPKFHHHFSLDEVDSYVPEMMILSIHNEFCGVDRYIDPSNPKRIAKKEFLDTFVEEFLK